MNVAYFPFENQANRYINISKTCIENAGNYVFDFSKINSKNVDNIDCVILNWYESASHRTAAKNIYEIASKIKKINLLKKKHVKIIYTFHNKAQHDTRNKLMKKICDRFYKWLLQNSNRIIVLSDDSKKYLSSYLSKEEINDKCFLIPHPNYIEHELNKDQTKSLNKNFKLLFFGQIRPYKNIEILIDVVRELDKLPIRLKIAGSERDRIYTNSLLKKIKPDDKNIEFEFRFFHEEELNKLFNESSVTVLPYDLRSSMNSGTVILSFSNARSVICPRISTLTDFDESLFYSYTYKNNKEHKEELKKEIIKAYKEWDDSPDKFMLKGRKLYEIVKKNNSIEHLTERYKQLFDSI